MRHGRSREYHRPTSIAIWQRGILLLLALAIVGGLSGCSREIDGQAVPRPKASPDTVAGLPATNEPSSMRPGVAEAAIPVLGTDNSQTDVLAKNATADVMEFWQAAFPHTFSGRYFPPLRNIVSYDSRQPGPKICNESTQGLVNAFYCPPADVIAWDRGEFMPIMQSTFGDIAPLTILAHEVGHAVHYRAGTANRETPVIVREQQADCFTGAFFRYAAQGGAKHFQVSTGQGVNQAMAVLNFVRDTPGKASFTSQNAHGSALDRVGAFQFGFAEGATRCAEMNTEDIMRRSTQFKFWKEAQETDLPVNDQALQAVQTSLQQVFRPKHAPTLSTQPCTATAPTPPATYCTENNTISLSLPELTAIAHPPTKDKLNSGYGDFAAYAQIASRYALAVQHQQGKPINDLAAGLRGACLVGAWSGLLVEDPIGNRNPVGTLRIAPGDVDEGVAALLGDKSLIASNVTGQQAPAGFARIEAFRSGFEHGDVTCSARY